MLQDPARISPAPPSHSELFASNPGRPSVGPVHALPAWCGTPRAVRCRGRNAGAGGPDCLGSKLGLPLSICMTLSSVLLSVKGENCATGPEALLGLPSRAGVRQHPRGWRPPPRASPAWPQQSKRAIWSQSLPSQSHRVCDLEQSTAPPQSVSSLGMRSVLSPLTRSRGCGEQTRTTASSPLPLGLLQTDPCPGTRPPPPGSSHLHPATQIPPAKAPPPDPPPPGPPTRTQHRPPPRPTTHSGLVLCLRTVRPP